MQGHSDPYDVGSQPVKEKNKNNRTRACATRLEILWKTKIKLSVTVDDVVEVLSSILFSCFRFSIAPSCPCLAALVQHSLAFCNRLFYTCTICIICSNIRLCSCISLICWCLKYLKASEPEWTTPLPSAYIIPRINCARWSVIYFYATTVHLRKLKVDHVFRNTLICMVYNEFIH